LWLNDTIHPAEISLVYNETVPSNFEIHPSSER